jgi:hypothetical protein
MQSPSPCKYSRVFRPNPYKTNQTSRVGESLAERKTKQKEADQAKSRCFAGWQKATKKERSPNEVGVEVKPLQKEK